ncbi:S41 family peptidase [Desulforegula conservatrix]|uniref:S41 family peptidase n=1 Tax=Desulforegula conservatrix TaxID=153026 RepID=UPI00040B783F|nr:S41 family peptidase [Desulforegula conservatrix]
MLKLTRKYPRLSTVLTVTVVICILGAGYVREIFAGAETSEETYKSLKQLTEVLEEIQYNYVDEVKPNELIQKAIEGMVSSLDPHSAFMPPENFADLQMETKGEFSGIGIVLTMKDGAITVISPIDGTPAAKAGIKAEDIILKVDDEQTRDMQLWEAVKKMRGKKGTHVKITIFREGTKEPLDFDLVRDDIPLESVKWAELEPGYGYVLITNFRESTAEDTEKAIKALESGPNPLKGLVIDLRGNPGGLLDQAIEIADLFIDKGPIVSTKGRKKENNRTWEATPNTTPRNYPIALLINSGSASASEIVAGALQDTNKAIVVGTTSFGKGSVQTVKPLKDGYGLKYTIARYYTPNGRSIQAEGIVPDIEVTYEEPKKDDKAAAEEKKKKSLFLKEKDLKNHLVNPGTTENGETKEKEKIEDKKDDKSAKKEKVKMRKSSDTFEAERLLDDNQVRRGLDLLIGYSVFKNIKTK